MGRRGLGLPVLFGAGFTTQRLADRWFESFSIPGYQAYETNQKMLKTFGSGEFLPLVAVFHSKGDVTKETQIQTAVEDGTKSWAGLALQLVLLDRQRRVRLQGPPHDLRRDLSAGQPDVHVDRADQAGARRDTRGGARRRHREPHGPRPALRGRGRQRRAVAPARGPDRRHRRAARAAVRLRHAARGHGAVARRGVLDPDDVQLRLDADLRHRRLDHRAVPRGARRPRAWRSTTRCS